MRPKLMRLAFAVCALALLGAACGSGRATEQSGVRRVVYWEKWTDFEGAAMSRIVDAFNEREREHGRREPGYRPIEVEMVVVSRIEQKLLIACAGGNPPDVAGIYSTMTAAYADKGALTDLSSRAAAANLSRERYVGHYYDLGEYRGKLWGLPTAPASAALHWNKRLFREAGLDPEHPPETLEELDAMAEQLTQWEVTLPNGDRQLRRGYLPDVEPSRKRLVQVGFLPSEPIWWNHGWGFVFGGKLLDGDKLTTAAPENVRAYHWVASYSRRLGVDAVRRFRSSFGSFASAQNPFLSGQLAMQLQGVWMYNFIQKFADGMQWGAAPFPAPAAKPELRGAGSAEADALVIPTGSRHVEEAWAFIEYTQRQDVMEQLCLGQRKPSPLSEVSDEFYAAHPNPNIRVFAALGSSKNAWSAPKTAVWNEYERELKTAVNKISSLALTPEVALGEVEQRLQLSYDRDRAISLRRAR